MASFFDFSIDTPKESVLQSQKEPDPHVIIIDRNMEEKGMRVTNFDRWLIAIIIAIIFFILALPFVFGLTNKVTKVIGVNTVTSNGGPSLVGVILHAVIFLILIRLLMH
jgi:hypothetical protein